MSDTYVEEKVDEAMINHGISRSDARRAMRETGPSLLRHAALYAEAILEHEVIRARGFSNSLDMRDCTIGALMRGLLASTNGLSGRPFSSDQINPVLGFNGIVELWGCQSEAQWRRIFTGAIVILEASGWKYNALRNVRERFEDTAEEEFASMEQRAMHHHPHNLPAWREEEVAA